MMHVLDAMESIGKIFLVFTVSFNPSNNFNVVDIVDSNFLILIF